MHLDSLPNVGDDLVRIHKVITRALDITLQHSQDSLLAAEHQEGFLTYIRVLTVLLHTHHAGEDEIAFPFWQERLPTGPYDELSAQHRQMVVYLEQVEHWLAGWPASTLAELHSSVSELRSLWLTHITLEEQIIGSMNARQYLTAAENEQLGRQLAEHGQAHAQPSEQVMPFVVYNLAGADRAEFVKILPPIMVEQLIPYAWQAAWAPMLPFLLAE